MRNKLENLRLELYKTACSDIDPFKKIKEIDQILQNYIDVYSIESSISCYIIQNENASTIKELQERQYAYQFADELIRKKGVHIEEVDPEDYRDNKTGDLPPWAHYEERRQAKIWVLK